MLLNAPIGVTAVITGFLVQALYSGRFCWFQRSRMHPQIAATLAELTKLEKAAARLHARLLKINPYHLPVYWSISPQTLHIAALLAPELAQAKTDLLTATRELLPRRPGGLE